MNESKLYLEKLYWQLELIADIEPGIVGKALEGHGGTLSTDQDEWADDILKHFLYRCFECFGAFLNEVGQKFRAKNSPLGILEDQVLAEWKELALLSDDELMASAVKTGLFVEHFPKDKSIYINSHRKEEGRRRLFNIFDLYDLGHNSTSGVERDYQLKKTVGQLAKSGPYRRFTFENKTIVKLCELKQTSPNFAIVTDRIIDAICVATKYSKPIRMTPILLVGEPGIGKSHYSFELSKCLGVPIAVVAMDNLQEGAGLAGSSFIYSNSQPGEVFKLLTEQDHLSPIVILDEIDKAGVSRYGDTLSPLHNLMEPVSARQFRDGSVGLPIDASHIIWIATANYLNRIPRTLLSRFEVFEISSDQGAKRAILEGIRDELKSEYHDIEFSDEVLEALCELNPREQRQLLERALSRTVRLGQQVVTLEHLEQVARQPKPEPPTTVIGYI